MRTGSGTSARYGRVMSRRVTVHRLGRVPYDEALELQERLQRARIRGAVGDTLLLLEHPKVITLGRGAKPANVLFSRERLEERGFTVHEIGRGGDVTYHGPGQLVGYPIVDLAPDRKDVRRYVRSLEQVMIDVCERHGLEAQRVDKLNGTWIGDSKVGAIGVRISRWVTMHGFALNVSTDLADFGVIVPCGIVGRGVTSLEAELGRAVPMAGVMDAVTERFGVELEAEMVDAEAAPLSGIEASAWAPEPWRG